MTIRLILTVCLCTITATAFAGKKKKAPKPKPEPKPLVRAGYKQVINSGAKTHELSIRVSRAEKGATGYVFAIYKSKAGGGVYTCQKEEIKIEAKKPEKQKKGKNVKKAEEPKQEPMKFTFPHANGNAAFVDYLVVLYQGGKIVSRASRTSIWKDAAEKLVENSEAPFNSRGEAIEAPEEGEGGGQALDDEMVKAALRLKSRIETEEKNRQMEKKMNK